MAIPVCPVTLFAAGLILDILTALYYVTVTKEKIICAVALNFLMVEFGYISWIYVMNQAKLDESLDNVHWYAMGCAVGTLIGLTYAAWCKRRVSVPKEPPKPVRRWALHESYLLKNITKHSRLFQKELETNTA